MNKEALMWGQTLLNRSLLEGGVLKIGGSHQKHWGRRLWGTPMNIKEGFAERGG